MANHVPLQGSERPMPSGAVRLRDADPDERVDVTVTLGGPALPEGMSGALSREQLERDYRARAGAVARVTTALERLGLRVDEVLPLTRSLRVSGTVAQLEAAFKPGLGVYSHPQQGEFRGREGQLQVPAELDGLITGVFGLDKRRVAQRRRAAAGPTPTTAAGPTPAASSPARRFFDAVQSSAPPLTPAQLAYHYVFPSGDGSGQRVAIAEFGGGYFASDLGIFCAKQRTPAPRVTAVGVNGTPVLTLAEIQQLPAQQQQQQLEDSVEVNMDVQIVAGLAPGAEQIVYFSGFDEQGWVDLIDEVVAGKPAPVIALSVSWGLAEDDGDWSQAALVAIDQRLQAAAALGITVCAAAGDDGSADQVTDGRAHIDFPASSPHVLAVGGTMLVPPSATDVVWWQSPGERSGGGGATGGGVSVIFPRPSWQDVHIASINPASIDGRVIPDVAALAGPPFYDAVFLGRDQPNGGTSAATPLWAALLALIAGAAQAPWQPSFLAPLLYAPADSSSGSGSGSSSGSDSDSDSGVKPTRAPSGTRTVGALGCTDVTSGDNTSSTLGRGYSAGPGFDAVSGWGVPNGVALLQALGRAE